MTTETKPSPTVEDMNRVIAEFDGGFERYWSDTLTKVWDHEKWDNVLSGGKHSEDLKYHSSWDWIMPVVEKIDEIYNKAIIHERFSILSLRVCGPKIHVVHEAVYAFIIWYNKQSKKP